MKREYRIVQAGRVFAVREVLLAPDGQVIGVSQVPPKLGPASLKGLLIEFARIQSAIEQPAIKLVDRQPR